MTAKQPKQPQSAKAQAQQQQTQQQKQQKIERMADDLSAIADLLDQHNRKAADLIYNAANALAQPWSMSVKKSYCADLLNNHAARNAVPLSLLSDLSDMFSAEQTCHGDAWKVSLETIRAIDETASKIIEQKTRLRLAELARDELEFLELRCLLAPTPERTEQTTAAALIVSDLCNKHIPKSKKTILSEIADLTECDIADLA